MIEVAWHMNPLIWIGLGAFAMLVFVIAAPNIWLAIYVRVFGRMP